ncbi:aspartate dehydrogenase [Shimia ponticola]|uniref:aspartate dehydrogenase n=1 Tax=Shimia ponticola TaxID=2582893 RepID=UPI0011BFBBB0|nr:aspartate dehydrogenase [Shimia ponticola]
MHIALIGFGSIGRELHARFADTEGMTLSALTRSPITDAPPELRQVHSLNALLEGRPDLVVECAGQGAVREFGATVLNSGTPLLIASVGALADPTLERDLHTAAKAGRAQLILPSGAIGGLDLLRAVSAEGDTTVSYIGTKPPAAWKGTAAEDRVDLDTLEQPSEFFSGWGREAVSIFPKNANVVAALALAGPGFERVKVSLVADPSVSGNIHSYQVTSPACSYEMKIIGAPSSGNAKTSLTTVLSIADEIRRFARLS